jgi:hypothetical protein
MKSLLALIAFMSIASTAAATDRFASCNVYNIVHYTGETIIELQDCERGIGSKSILSAAKRDTFLLNKLYQTFSTRTALGIRTTEVV